MAAPGVHVVEQLLPDIKKNNELDLIIAQAENVTDGKGLSKADYKKLKQLGIDAFTGGNHTLFNNEIFDDLNDPQQPIVRPANYPEGTPGKQYKFVQTPKGKVLIVSLLGSIVGRDSAKPTDNPLKVIDAILEETKREKIVATVVNMHGDYSSEKVITGHYLDGRVSLVVGDHWHVPTADAMVLPKKTAYISDVGMCGTLHSSLGVKFDSVVPRWRDGKIMSNEIETKGTLQLNGVIADIDESTSLATGITQVRGTLDD